MLGNSITQFGNQSWKGKKAHRLAVLMTCHNRASSTTQSISALKAQILRDMQIDLFLVDDGSKDGTAQAVIEMLPAATVIPGDGNLFWCGGTRLAFSRALEKDYDFYLWLNDDTSLYPDTLQKMIATYHEAEAQTGKALIVVGSTKDPETGLFSYGGWRSRRGRLGTHSWEKLPPEISRWTFCDTFNGNCVLIPREVVQRIGNLDQVFRHSMGDLDYGLRAKKSGCQIVIASGYMGDCKDNDGSGLWADHNQPTFLRWQKLLGPKGLPIKEWGLFTWRHKGVLWPLVWMSPYIRFWIQVFFPTKTGKK